MMTKQYLQSAAHAFIASVLIVALMALSYFIIEPQVGRAQDTSGPFTITQEIIGETSFIVDAVNTTMVGSLNGITGGTANGSTTVAVRTNSPTGYTMDIAFFNNGTDNAMLGSSTASESIRDYPAVGGEPTFTFSTASTSAVFAYTVSSLDSADLDQSFLDSGSECNTGSGFTAERCWMEPMTSSFQIIDRSTDAPTGATSTLHFRVHVPNNPTPGVVVDMYIATATLTVAPQ
jgi:hypothetical protein